MDQWPNPPSFPSLSLPEAPGLPAPVLEVPRAGIPSYKPLVVPPSDLRPPPGVRGVNEDKGPDRTRTKTPQPKPTEVQMIDVPFTDQEIPMPSTEIMTAAATTAVISVAATLTATSIFKYLVMVMKPLLKQAWSKLTKKKNQKSPS